MDWDWMTMSRQNRIFKFFLKKRKEVFKHFIFMAVLVAVLDAMLGAMLIAVLNAMLGAAL